MTALLFSLLWVGITLLTITFFLFIKNRILSLFLFLSFALNFSILKKFSVFSAVILESLLTGLILGFFISRQAGFKKIFLWGLIPTLFFTFLEVRAPDWEQILKYYQETVQNSYSEFEPLQKEQLILTLRQILDWFRQLFWGFLAVETLMTLFIVLWLWNRLAPGFKIVIPVFAEWQMPDFLIWLTALGILCSLWAVQEIQIAGWNLLLVLGLLYLLQGLAVLKTIFIRMQLKKMTAALIYGCFFLTSQITIPLFASIGLFDTWFNFRKKINSVDSTDEPFEEKERS